MLSHSFFFELQIDTMIVKDTWILETPSYNVQEKGPMSAILPNGKTYNLTL